MPHRTQLQLIKRRLSGVLVQLVEIPGLLSGAAEDRGRGRALLGVLRSADAIVYCLDVGGPYEMLQDVRNEVALAGIDLPSMLAATKMDEANEGDLAALQEAVPDLPVEPSGARWRKCGDYHLVSMELPSKQTRGCVGNHHVLCIKKKEVPRMGCSRYLHHLCTLLQFLILGSLLISVENSAMRH